MSDSLDFSRFTDRARRVIALASQEATCLEKGHIDTEDILVGLLKDGCGIGPSALRNMGVILSDVQREIRTIVKPNSEGITTNKPSLSPEVTTVIEFSRKESQKLGHDYVGTEHLLLGVLYDSKNVAALVLKNLGCNLTNVRKEVLLLLTTDLQQIELSTPYDFAAISRSIDRKYDTWVSQGRPISPPEIKKPWWKIW